MYILLYNSNNKTNLLIEKQGIFYLKNLWNSKIRNIIAGMGLRDRENVRDQKNVRDPSLCGIAIPTYNARLHLQP